MLELVNISKSIGGSQIIKNISLRLESSSILGIVGANGSGKTTLLQIIAGILEQDTGLIYLDQKRIDEIDRGERKIAIVPQSLHQFLAMKDKKLFGFTPGINVEKNIVYLLFNYKKALYWLDLFELTEVKNKFPHELSWGQQQKLALARMMIQKPRILLLDEAFSATDYLIKDRLKKFLKRYIKENRITAIYTSTDSDDARDFCDKIIFLNNGEVKYNLNDKEKIESNNNRGIKMNDKTDNEEFQRNIDKAKLLIRELQSLIDSAAGSSHSNGIISKKELIDSLKDEFGQFFASNIVNNVCKEIKISSEYLTESELELFKENLKSKMEKSVNLDLSEKFDKKLSHARY